MTFMLEMMVPLESEEQEAGEHSGRGLLHPGYKDGGGTNAHPKSDIMVVMAIFNIQSVFRTGAAGVGWCPHLYKPVCLQVILDLLQYLGVQVKRALSSDRPLVDALKLTAFPAIYLLHRNGTHAHLHR